MPGAFQKILFDLYPNTSGGQIQAQAKANQLQTIGYRVSFSTVSSDVLWQNHANNDVTDMAASPSGVLLLTAVNP